MTEHERVLKDVKRVLRTTLSILEDEANVPEPQTVRNAATSLNQAGTDLFVLHGQLIAQPK